MHTEGVLLQIPGPEKGSKGEELARSDPVHEDDMAALLRIEGR